MNDTKKMEMPENNKIMDKLREWSESEDGKKHFERINKQHEIREKRYARFEEYLKTHDFDKLMYRLFNEHNDDYIDKCYHQGCEPYPTNKLWFVFSYAMKHGKATNVKELDTGFPQNTYLFKNYYFQLIYGQGTLIRIYNKDDMKLLLQL